jgi:preprotein translocase subunit SecB
VSAITPGVSAIIRAVQILDVRLIDLTAKTTVRSFADIGEAAIDTGRSVKVLRREPDNSFVVHVVMETKAVAGEKKETVFCARAGYEITYQLPQALNPAEDDLRDFAEINGVFNAWSYWRELVQSMTARMGLPPLVLPVFRLADALQPKPLPDQANALPADRERSGPETVPVASPKQE